MPDIGYYTLPVIPSMEGIDASINKSFGDKFKVAGVKAGKDFSKGAGDGLKALQRDLDETAKSYQKMEDKAKDSLGKVRKEEAALADLRKKGITDGPRLVAAEERLASARRNSARATREAEDGHKKLQVAQKLLADGAGDTAGKFGTLSSLAGAAGISVAGLATAAAAAAVGGIALLAAGAIKVTSELYNLGQQFDDMSDNLRVKTGISGAALDGLTKSVENISKSTPSAVSDIGKVVAETTRALHLTGPELESMSKNIANLNRLTGEDTDVKALGQAFRGFGIAAKDQVPALNSLFQTYQKTGIGVNELLASVVKGGPQLREFGFDLGSSAGLLSQFEQAGLDGDKALSALTKGLATFAKAGKEPKQALADTVTEVKRLISVSNEPAAQNLANTIFGAKAGLQIFSAIKDGTLDVQRLQESMSSAGDTIQSASDDTADWAEKWQVLKNKAEAALRPVSSGVFEGINAQLESMAAWVEGHQAQIIDFFVTLGDTVITFAEVSIKSFGLFSEGLGQLIAPIGDVLGGILKSGAALQRLTGDTKTADEWDRQAESLFGLGEGLTAVGRATKDINLQALRDGLHNAGEAAKAALTQTTTLGASIVELARKSVNIQIKAETDQADAEMRNFIDKWKTAVISPPVAPTYTPGNPGSLILPQAGRAKGGVLPGYSPGVDNMLVPMSGGEGVIVPQVMKQLGPEWLARLNAGGGAMPLADVAYPGDSKFGPYDPKWGTSDRKPALWPDKGPYPGGSSSGVGGDGGLPPGWQPNPDDKLFPDFLPPGSPWKKGPSKRIRLFDTGYAGGGVVGGPDVTVAEELVGTPYSQGNRNDCSGMVARVISRAMGLPEDGLMSTKNAQEWLAARGFKSGMGGPGMISVGWYDHGPNPNDGHMAMTLSDGTNAEAGGTHGNFLVGGDAKGAGDPQFDQHMYLPTLFGEGQSGGASSPYGAGQTSGGGTYSAPDAKAVRESTQKVADADARVKQAEQKQKELKADAKQSEKDKAQSDVDKAKREAKDARDDLETVKKGKFTPGKDGKSGGQGGMGQFGELGGIAGSFLKETFGIDGSFLPDLSSLGIVQMGGNLLNAFKGPLQGLVDGGLGIQQPGWSPGDPVGGAAAPSLAPFGMGATQMPSGIGAAAAGGIGSAAGPTSIDNSTHINSPTGDPADIENRIRRANMNRPRIASYTPPGPAS